MQNNLLLEDLNEAQRKAVLHGEGPAFVAAGPGSGKTFTITRRLLYLIQERKIPPQKILVITFTKEAAKSMQDRFLKQLQRFGTSRTASSGFVSFGTFHSYFYQIIKSIKKYSEYQLITQQEKRRIAKPILKEFCKEEVTESAINEFLTQVSFYKNTGRLKIAPVQQQEGKRTEPQSVCCPFSEEENNSFQKMFEKYEAEKHRYKRLDFDDMLYLCKKALCQDKKLLQYWQHRFSYVLIDEFQDINPIQYEIIRMLCIPPYELFVVGDDDQAIYGFRGSDSKIFLQFLQDYKDAVTISLAVNYRCGGTIVKASRKLIEHNTVRVMKELRACMENASKGQIRAIGAIHTKESYGKVIEKLKGRPPYELEKEAVLFRTNAAMRLFAAELTRNQIPFVLREKCESVYEHFLMKDMEDFFQAAEGQKDRVLFLRLFQKQRVCLGREALHSEQVDLQQVKDFYGSGFYESKQAVAAVEALERHLKQLAAMRPKLGIAYILHAMDYEGYLRRKAGGIKNILDEWKELLDWLMEDAGEFADWKSWKEYQDICEKDSLEEKGIAFRKKQGIHLLTMHASKGLEYDKVYLMNLNEGVVPKYGKGEELTREHLEEERRLFYVGMTRAKEEVELHYLTGTKENPRQVSRFVKELGL